MTDETTFEISTEGRIDDDVVERARERLGRVASHCRERITHAELRITDDLKHPDQAHARVEATFVVKRGPVRAHAQAMSVAEAVDLMLERLRRRVDRHESKLHRADSKHHDGVAENGSWRHGDVASAPRHAEPLGDRTATVVRRKSFATAPMTVEEAAFDLDILDHTFYLFEEADSGEVCVISHEPDGGYRLAIDKAVEVELPEDLAVARTGGAPILDKASAQRLLSTGDDPFVFHRVNADQWGRVLYRRYDGDLGIIELERTEP